jgi:hypothetical protein
MNYKAGTGNHFLKSIQSQRRASSARHFTAVQIQKQGYLSSMYEPLCLLISHSWRRV